MDGAHRRLFEITNLMQGDAEGNSLMEEVLNACVDYALPSMDDSSIPTEVRADRLDMLVAALERFNAYVAGRFSSFRDGLFQGAANEVALWSEELTFQIMANRPN